MKKIPIKTETGTRWLNEDFILRFEACGKHTCVFLANNTKITSIALLKHYHDMLHKKGFYRIDRKRLVNMNHIIYVSKGKYPIITLSCTTLFPVSYRNSPDFKNYMLAYNYTRSLNGAVI